MDKNIDNQESPMERFFRMSTGKVPQSEEFKNALKKVSQNKELVEKFEKLESDTKILLQFEKVQKKIQYTSKVTGKDIVDVLLSTDITSAETSDYVGYLLSGFTKELKAKVSSGGGNILDEVVQKGKVDFSNDANANLQEVNRIRDEIMARFVVAITSANNEPDKEEKVKKMKDLVKKFQREKLAVILNEARYKTFQEGMSHVDTLNALLHPPKSWIWENRTKILVGAVIVLVLYILFK